jgi:hypothetical protein
MSSLNSKLAPALFPILAATLLAMGCGDSTAPSSGGASAAGPADAQGLASGEVLKNNPTDSAAAPTFATSTVAVPQGIDATCRKTSVSSGWHRQSEYIPAAGVGLVAWNVWLTGTAYDRCSHGSLNGAVYMDMSGLRAKDRNASLNPQVWFRTSRSSTWRLGYKYGWSVTLSSFQYAANSSIWHLDLLPTERVTQVAIGLTPTLLGAVGWQKWLICNFATLTCS